MSPETLSTLAVGMALLAFGWRVYTSLRSEIDRLRTDTTERLTRIEADLTSIKERLSRIEGWIAGRFGEEPVTSA